MLEVILIGIISYLLGSIPFGLIFAKSMGFGDIRTKGSKNIGATNAWRIGGKKLGILTLTFDILKAVIPLSIMKYQMYDNQLLAFAGLLLILGHIFPIWLNFKGGKGVATMLAVLITLTPILGVLFIFIWLGTFMITKLSSLSSLIATTLITLSSLFLLKNEFSWMIISIFFLVLYRHKENIVRLLHREEPKLEK